MPWKTIYNPAPGKRGARNIGTVTAVYTDGEYSFSMSEKVEIDDQSEKDKFKKKINEAMIAHRANYDRVQPIQEDLDLFLNS